MKIAFLVGSMQPGGVSDHARLLAMALNKKGHHAQVFELTPAINNPESESLLKEQLAQFNPDWVSIQFVPFSFHPKGLCKRVAPLLKNIIPKKAKIEVMFHELWTGAQREALIRYRLLGILQKIIIRDLLKKLKPDCIHTHARIYQHLLLEIGYNARFLPIFGNVPIHAPLSREKLLSDLPGVPQNALLIALFGSLFPEWPSKWLLPELEKSAKALGRPICLVSMGHLNEKSQKKWDQLLKNHPSSIFLCRLENLNDQTLSGYLQACDGAISPTPWMMIGKSSAAATLLEHGLSVMVDRDDNSFLCIPKITPRNRIAPVRPDTLKAALATLRKVDAKSTIDQTVQQFLTDLKNEPKTIRKNILIICPTQGVYGGMESLVLNLATYLSARHYVQIFWRLVEGFSFGDELLTRCEKTGALFEVGSTYSYRLLEKIRWANCIHTHNISLPTILFAKILRKPTVATIHHQGITKNILRSLAWKMGARLVDVRLFVSEFVRKKWNVEPATVVPSSEMPETAPLIKPRKGFFFIGRWIEGKGIPELIEAYQLAKINKEEWPLVMAGTGPLQKDIKKMLTQSPIPGVTILGFISDEEKSQCIASAKWTVVPPTTPEDLGLVPIEARKMCVPSIVTKSGGLVEAAGPAALICLSSDAETLKKSLEEASQMSESDYIARCHLAYESLNGYLLPFSFYETLYNSIS